MALTIELFCAICFVLVQLFLLKKAQGKSLTSFDNATDYESSWISGRSKRSLVHKMPYQLQICMEYLTANTECLVFVKTDQKIANHNLPVDAPANYIYRDTVMDDIGEFVMYQNVARYSAIVYFEKLEAIFGIHGTDYYIQGHPLKLDMEYHDPVIVKSPHLVKIEFTPFPVDPIFVPHNLPMNKDEGSYGNDQNKEQMMNTQAGPSMRPDSIQENTGGISDKEDGAKQFGAHNDEKQERISGTYYLETLVFISKDVTEIYYNAFKDDYINEIVRYYLIYFNAVDLFFRQSNFHGINIHINIAKIVIEDDILRPFDFISQREVHFIDLMSQLPAYLRKYSSDYPPDSFDHVFIVTVRPIMLETTSARALTKSGDDLILARGKGKFYEAVPFTVIRAENHYSGYSHAAEEIGQVLSPDIDPLEYKERLEWSQNSLNQFKIFFSKNPNRVFFRNTPRSLLPPGPHILISPEAQCKCLGYEYYRKRSLVSAQRVLQGACLEPLQCNKIGIEQPYSASIWPLEGTPCGKNAK
ncbi:hypothetical protein PV325_007506, partial [Microctonus aethiopoides]